MRTAWLVVLVGLLPTAAAGGPLGLPLFDTDQCTVTGPGSCPFLCDSEELMMLIGVGGPASSFRLWCSGGGEASCAPGTAGACIVDLTAVPGFTGRGLCFANGGVLASCGDPTGVP